MTVYSDDRHGCMRIHIAEQRAWDAHARYNKYALLAHAKSHGVTVYSTRPKFEIGFTMAQHGLIAEGGALREGWPA